MNSQQPKTVFSTTGEILLLVYNRLNNQRFLIDLDYYPVLGASGRQRQVLLRYDRKRR